MNQATSIVSIALLAAHASAAITENGPWTGNNWYDNNRKIGVNNGIPFSKDLAEQRWLDAPLTVDRDIDADYMTFTNAQRVASLFTEQMWEQYFPQRNPVYTYQGFLKAVAKFPKFCGETNLNQSLDTTCKRELATLFAHWGQETGKRDPADGPFWTQALYYLEEIRCEGTFRSDCDYKSSGWSATAYPSNPNEQYYGRGPFQLSWNYNYGFFSKIITPSTFDNKLFLLNNPDLVHLDGFYPFAAAIWFYMTPQAPKPSMHDVMTGYYVPNSIDLNKGFTATFGTTTNIINGGFECSGSTPSSKAESRAEYYLEWLNVFGLPAEDGLGCTGQGAFQYGGAGDKPGYWFKKWNGEIACEPVGYQTAYSISARDDYKRCICELFGNGAADCPAGSEGDSGASTDNYVPDEPDNGGGDTPSGGDDPNNGGTYVPGTPDPVWKTDLTPAQIAQNPHYSSSVNSRTHYQIDRSLDVIQESLEQLLQAASGLM